MIRKSYGNYVYGVGEPILRSCWKCNPAHKHLKNTKFLHICLICGRSWIFGKYLDVFKTDEEYNKFMEINLKKGE